MYMFRGRAIKGARGARDHNRPPTPLKFNFQTKQGPTVSVSNFRNTAFYG